MVETSEAKPSHVFANDVLAGKVAVVTGGAGGIGSSICSLFAAKGAAVWVADNRIEQARSVAESIRNLGGVADAFFVDIADPVSAQDMVSKTIDRFGKVDFLIHTAAIDAPRGLAWEIDVEHWRTVTDVNLSGAWWCCKAVLPHMMRAGAGRVVLLSSVSYRQGSDGVSVAYNAAKAGLVGLTIGLAKQVERHGILVNAVAPGSIGTGQPMTEEEIAYDTANFPIPIVGPGPVADACLYLCADTGRWISGTVMNVSGGRMHG
ncbi:SDR family oxidoreductase [Rhizobium pusense]|uniref:SDR family NAD(P)-dependent oxidoreductase n=1 Tax=Agrobacterium pusense TaxID=648995 RepID=UPI00244B3E30|nr:SDR family NAD(P)-dependent oxidoreductase [Agrobacterium pusense]MDH2091626.1 SDR family oxidoreductase [Agrobacterium pusense]